MPTTSGPIVRVERRGPLDLRAELATGLREARYHWVAGALDPSARVLDAGCGFGDGVSLLTKAGLEVTGVDHQEAIAVARGLVPEAHELIAGSLSDLPAAADQFDAVICFGDLPAGDEPHVLAELARVARPDGLVFVSAPNLTGDPTDADTVGQTMRAMGLGVTIVRERILLISSSAASPDADPVVPEHLRSRDAAGSGASQAIVIASLDRSTSDWSRAHPLATELDSGRSVASHADLGTQLAVLRDELSRTRHELAELGRLDRALLKAEPALAVLPDLVESHRTTRSLLVDTTVLADRARSEADEALRRLEEKTAALDEARDAHGNAVRALDELRRSRSWRLTAPVRWAASLRRPAADA